MVGSASAYAGGPQMDFTPMPYPARVAQARNLNLKVVNKDGQQLFCRSNYMTTSRIQRDTTCYTADQLDDMEARQQRELDQLNNRPSNGAKNPFSN